MASWCPSFLLAMELSRAVARESDDLPTVGAGLLPLDYGLRFAGMVYATTMLSKSNRETC